MALSVLVNFGNGLTIKNPSAEIEASPESFAEVVRVFRESPAKYFCPHCYAKAGVMAEVKFRAPEQRRVHFYHRADAENKGCPHASKESDWHINAKAAIAESLKVKGIFQDVRQEWWMKAAERRPDIIAVYPNGAIEAHEVQISPISAADLRHRTEDLRTRGNCAKVVWYLGKGAFNPENRRLLRSLSNVECYRLAFPTQDADFPEWMLDDRVIPSPVPQKSSQSSACHRRAGSKKHLPAPPEKPAPVIDLYQSPRSVVITAPHPSRYTGMALDAIGESEGLIVVPLPKLGDRPDYQGFFLPEHVQFA